MVFIEHTAKILQYYTIHRYIELVQEYYVTLTDICYWKWVRCICTVQIPFRKWYILATSQNHPFAKSVLRHKFLILDTSHPDILYLREQGCRGLCLFFKTKRGTQAKVFL